jgi:hypothetical protein
LLIDQITLQGDLLCKRSEDEFIVVGALDIGDEGRNIDPEKETMSNGYTCSSVPFSWLHWFSVACCLFCH